MKLGGTKLKGAKLPEDSNFDDHILGIRHLGIITSCYTILIILLLFCYFLANISDYDIHTQKYLYLIILGGVRVSIPNNYWLWVIIPTLLLGVYLAIHLHLHENFFNQLIELPSVLPNGRELDKVVRAGFFNSFISKGFPHLTGNYGLFNKLIVSLLIIVYWISFPLLLFYFFLKFLPFHDPYITTIHFVLFIIITFLGVYSYYLGQATLHYGVQIKGIKDIKNIQSEIVFGLNIKYKRWFFIVNIVLVFITSLLAIVSYSAILFSFQLPIDFCYSDFSNKEIKEVVFRNSNFPYNLRYLLGHGCKLIGCTIYGADLYGGRLRKSSFLNTTMKDSDLTKADLVDSTWEKGDLSGASFSEAELNKAKFYGTDLLETKWKKANLSKAEFHGNNLIGSDFEGADLQGAKFKNLQSCDNNKIKTTPVNLRLVSFKGADLSGADLSYLSLEKVNFAGAIFKGTNLRNSILTESENLPPIEQLKREAIIDGAKLPNTQRK